MKDAENLGKTECSEPKSLSSRLETVKIQTFLLESVLVQSVMMICVTVLSDNEPDIANLSDQISVWT